VLVRTRPFRLELGERFVVKQAVDELLDHARAVTDTAERHALCARVWQQESSDLPLIYLYTQRNIQGVSNTVGGFTLLADGPLRRPDVRPAH
jgi:peptide/nickel transport system substrate-binding protein